MLELGRLNFYFYMEFEMDYDGTTVQLNNTNINVTFFPKIKLFVMAQQQPIIYGDESFDLIFKIRDDS